MSNQLRRKLTQHQKRILVIENLYQFFLESNNTSNFKEYYETVIKPKLEPAIITVFDELVWYETTITKQIETNLKPGWVFKNLKPIEKAILFLGSYEILYTNTKKAIVINEAVILAKQYGDENVYRYINGVLDKINCPN